MTGGLVMTGVMTGGVVAVTLNAAVDQTLECPGFAAGTVNRVVRQTVTAGGKGINVAAFLADTAPITAAGFLGRDNVAVFETLFQERGITDRCQRLDGASRVNIKVVDHSGGAVTDINLPGLAVTADALAQLIATVENLAVDNHWFVLAGSVPAGVPETIYADLVTRLRARGAFVTVDASGAPLRHAIAARPSFIKPNVDELGDALGTRLTDRVAILDAARQLQRSGIDLVVVSLGADGAILVDEHQAVHAYPPRVPVASTVGAGDAMVAGVLMSRLAGEDLVTCARRATAVAAGKLAQVGPILPSRARIAELMESVRIEGLEPQAGKSL
ncbi:MAG: 1-phosphofructokinase [Azospirillaceae bacterium]|nr:1-phosphofructokinase [Azospirillaceae bacterium]